MLITTAGGGMIAGSLLGGLMGGSSSGGSTTQNKNPWAAAVPWLQANLATGQNLQGYYQANPFNGIQQAAYGNLLSGNNYINNMVPGLLSQMSQQTGYDRNNPGRAAPIRMPSYSMSEYQPATGGLLTQSMQAAQNAAPAGAALAAANKPASQEDINPYLGMVNSPGDLFNLASIYGGK